MEWQFIAPMAVMLTLILTTGGVIVLRPLTKRLGDLLHVIAQQKRSLPPDHELVQIRDLMSSMEARLSLLEERQAFTEALLADEHRRAGALPRGSAADPSANHSAAPASRTLR